MATWPATLPAAPFVEGYQEGPGSSVLASPMDAGPAKIRRRFTAAPRRFSVRYGNLTRAQVSTFETFFHDTLLDGSLPFDWEHPRTGATVTARIVAEVDPPYTLTPVHTGAKWALEFQIEVQP